MAVVGSLSVVIPSMPFLERVQRRRLKGAWRQHCRSVRSAASDPLNPRLDGALVKPQAGHDIGDNFLDRTVCVDEDIDQTRKTLNYLYLCRMGFRQRAEIRYRAALSWVQVVHRALSRAVTIRYFALPIVMVKSFPGSC